MLDAPDAAPPISNRLAYRLFRKFVPGPYIHKASIAEGQIVVEYDAVDGRGRQEFRAAGETRAAVVKAAHRLTKELKRQAKKQA